jgi:hypothetical protein
MVVDLFRKNRFFFVPYALVLLLFGTWQVVYSQEQLMQWVNSRNSPLADLIFPYITYRCLSSASRPDQLADWADGVRQFRLIVTHIGVFEENCLRWITPTA